LPRLVQHFDAASVAELEVRRRGFALGEVSSMRFSTRQADPTLLSLFDTVPIPIIVPADSRRVRAACAISL